MILNTTTKKSFMVFILITFASKYLYDYYGKKRKNAKKEIHEVIMFSHGEGEFKKSKYSRCMITKSMDRLLYYLSTPKYTLDICIYVLTNQDLSNVVMKLHYRGVKIRIIVDADMAYCSGSTVRRLEKQGIPVRWMKSTNLMHHKFCLIDTGSEETQTTPLVIMGSLNWTNQALYGNWEDLTVTSQSELVAQFKTEFERLWGMFKPIVGLK